MRVIHYNNIDFSIEADGEIIRRSTWHAMPNENFSINDDWPGFRDELEQWAGLVGDAWRLPATDSQSYTEDAEYIISEINFKSLSRHTYEVAYTGRKKHLTAEIIGGISENINNSDERTRSAVWLVHAYSLDNWLPQIGDVMEWAGSDFICESIQLEERADNEWEVKITAKDISVMMVGQPSFSRNDGHESIRKAQWRIGLEALESFIADHDINSDASNWAGEAYYVSDIDVSPHGKIAYYVTLEARKIQTRLLEVKRSESFNGYDSEGGINKTINWTGRWRVHRDSLPEFENKVGQSAADWSVSGAIISKVEPARITDLIYEVTMEAIDPENSGASNIEFNTDDRSRLASRKDVICKEVDYVLAAEECGWYENSHGKYMEIQEWDPDKQCPFTASEKLPLEMVNTKLKCVFVSEISFLRGRSKAHVGMNLEWSRTSRVETKVAGVSGSWLKKSFDTEEVFDNEGKRWTKIIRSYIHAPVNFQWNSNYGEHK